MVNYLKQKMSIFKIKAKSEKTMARRGEVTMAHGKVQTPNFMPIGTQ